MNILNTFEKLDRPTVNARAHLRLHLFCMLDNRRLPVILALRLRLNVKFPFGDAFKTSSFWSPSTRLVFGQSFSVLISYHLFNLIQPYCRQQHSFCAIHWSQINSLVALSPYMGIVFHLLIKSLRGNPLETLPR